MHVMLRRLVVHHGEPIGAFGGHAHVMRDQHQHHAEVQLQLARQVENLGLSGHVERKTACPLSG